MPDETTEGRFVRPYAITGGRTGADVDLDLETQVEATEKGLAALERYRWEASQVIDVCRSAIAVVEVSAKLSLPVGVVRVVIADLERDGALEVHRAATPAPAEGESYTDLLERVLDGIRSL